jgi:hypothetical protein
MRATLFGLIMATSWFLAGKTYGQDTLVVVYGVLKDFTTKDTLRELSVEATDQKWGRRVAARMTQDGQYVLDMVDEAVWLIEYAAPGYIPKRILVELRGPTAEQWIGGFGMNVDMLMLRELPGLDYSVLQEPMGVCRYDSASGIFVWDSVSVARMRDRVEPLHAAYNKRLAASAR